MSVCTPSKILVVEDDEGVAVLERRALERCGFAVQSAANSLEAETAVQAGDIDLLVTDYCLPDSTTGLELVSRLKARGFDLPVIMVTGFSNEATAIQCLRHGVRDFVPKTTEYLDYLPVAVERVLGAVRTERRLAESETRFQQFMDNSPAVAFLKDASGRMLYANRRCQEKHSPDGWQGKTTEELWPPETAKLLRQHDAEVLRRGTAMSFHEPLVDGDGSVRHWLTYRFPIVDDKGEFLIGGVAIDITQQRLAEKELQEKDEQLRQSQKMEAVGQLAGGVAHDFNNLLTIIMGYSDLLLQGLTPDGMAATDLIAEISRAGERASLLTRQLLAFSRRQVLEPKLISVNAIVSNMETLLGRLIGENIEIRTRLMDQSDCILADAGQIEQVIMNLAVNARDAMPQGGEFSIETSHVAFDAAHAAMNPDVKPGTYVLITVKDTGHGMDEATKARIFEPFFSTKEVGKGTGLGLATVYGIVKQSGGFIGVFSEVGRGTTFNVYLPAAPQSRPSARIHVDNAKDLFGAETVLLVEDDSRVLEFSRAVLQAYGYTVLVASDPIHAIKVSGEHQGIIDLLMTDVVMPHLNGRRLAELLQSERPEMKVLYVSGYTDDAVVRQGILEADVNFLQKPFTPQLLAAKIRSLFSKSTSGELIGRNGGTDNDQRVAPCHGLASLCSGG